MVILHCWRQVDDVPEGIYDRVVKAEKPKQVNIRYAKAHIAKLLANVERGQEIVLARGRTPIAKLVPIPAKSKNRIKFGDLKGKIWIADDFDDPLPDELLKEWGLL